MSEELIAEALYPYPQGLVITTKGGVLSPSQEQRVPDGRPEHLRAALEGSLKRLRLERIDLYQLHRPDPKVPIAQNQRCIYHRVYMPKPELVRMADKLRIPFAK